MTGHSRHKGTGYKETNGSEKFRAVICIDTENSDISPNQKTVIDVLCEGTLVTKTCSGRKRSGYRGTNGVSTGTLELRDSAGLQILTKKHNRGVALKWSSAIPRNQAKQRLKQRLVKKLKKVTKEKEIYMK